MASDAIVVSSSLAGCTSETKQRYFDFEIALLFIQDTLVCRESISCKM